MAEQRQPQQRAGARRALMLALLVTVGVVAVSCGGPSGSTSEDRPIGEEVDATPDTGSALPPLSTPTAVPTPEPFIYIVKEGDTLATIADEFSTSVSEIQAVNQLLNPNLLSIGQELEIPQNVSVVRNEDGTVRPGNRVHIVQEGDTLLAIALRYDKTLDELMAVNGLSSPDLIAVGDALTIPSAAP